LWASLPASSLGTTRTRRMFAIVISEKGGAERRELFDKHEINVGRVQGNDLMLPKGNVSKRHARLLFRDGRFIVTDLKSTNGTYVNGRKIAQATIVREGDKIYVGDFVLRVEQGGPAVSSNPGRPAPIVATVPSGSVAAAPVARASVASFEEFTARHEGISIPSAPESGEGTGRHTLQDISEVGSGSAPKIPAAAPVGRSAAGESAANQTVGDMTREPPPPARPTHAPPIPTLVPRSPFPHPSSPLPEQRMVSGRALALAALVEKVAEAMDLTPLARGAEPDQVLAHRIERVVREKAKALRDDGQLPDSIEIDDAIRDAQREILGLGALEPLIEDEEVHEIRVLSHDNMTVLRGDDAVEIDPAFSSENALGRAIVRLCRQSGQPLAPGETIVERYLPRGLLVQAVLPPTSQYGHALVLKKRRRAEIGLDDLVRSGTISRAMANFLHGCVTARSNLLLVGPQDGTAMLLSALAIAGHGSGGIVALQSVDELWGLEPAPVCIRLPEAVEQASRLVRAGAKLGPERLVINPMNGHLAAAVASAIAEGCEGVLAAVIAPSLRHGMDRLVPDMMAARPGLTAEAARGWLAGSFEVAVEIAKLRDGRFRVMRIAQLAGEHDSADRDIFTFVIERTAAGGTIEGSFHPTGVVPRVAEELAARGGGFDSALFKRDRG
jgi:pilus assembly protein CpaF